VDSNQAEIVEALRGIPGCTVAITSAVGGGFPDLLVGYRGFNFCFEIKDPTKPTADQSLTDDQKKWHANWRGQVTTVYGVLDIINFITGGYRE
jgi:hypothetical protein